MWGEQRSGRSFLAFRKMEYAHHSFHLMQLSFPSISELYPAFRTWLLNPFLWEGDLKMLINVSFPQSPSFWQRTQTPESKTKEGLLLTAVAVAKVASFSCTGSLSWVSTG